MRLLAHSSIETRAHTRKNNPFYQMKWGKGSELIESRGGKKTHPIIIQRLLMLILLLPTESQNVDEEGEQKQKPFVGFSSHFQRG